MKVITYGTFDLFHEGHYRLLQRAKALGDYLIVAVTSDYFDKCRGKFNVHDSLMTRIENVKKSGFADEIIIEEYIGQKIDDIKRLNVDIFTVGSDWEGYFDYLSEYCKVVYLDRTKGISSTQIRNSKMVKIGVVGCEQIVNRFVDEFNYVSGAEIIGCFSDNGRTHEKLKNYAEFESLLNDSDAVYVNIPLHEKYVYIKQALLANKHVITEFPFSNCVDEAKELFEIAKTRNLVLMEGLKTAYCPGFNKLVSLVKSGIIGKMVSVDAGFTQILGDGLDEQIRIAGGSVESLVSYPLLAIFKLLGMDYKEIRFLTHKHDNVDLYTRAIFTYENAIATATVGIAAKSEGCLVISGTKGYIYVPAPWWKTEFFEVRYEDINKNNKYFYKFEGEGLRYELVEFVKNINSRNFDNLYLNSLEMLAESRVIEQFLNGDDVINF